MLCAHPARLALRAARGQLAGCLWYCCVTYTLAKSLCSACTLPSRHRGRVDVSSSTLLESPGAKLQLASMWLRDKAHESHLKSSHLTCPAGPARCLTCQQEALAKGMPSNVAAMTQFVCNLSCKLSQPACRWQRYQGPGCSLESSGPVHKQPGPGVRPAAPACAARLAAAHPFSASAAAVRICRHSLAQRPDPATQQHQWRQLPPQPVPARELDMM